MGANISNFRLCGERKYNFPKTNLIFITSATVQALFCFYEFNLILFVHFRQLNWELKNTYKMAKFSFIFYIKVSPVHWISTFFEKFIEWNTDRYTKVHLSSAENFNNIYLQWNARKIATRILIRLKCRIIHITKNPFLIGLIWFALA